MDPLFGNQFALFSALCHWFPSLISTAGFLASHTTSSLQTQGESANQDSRGDTEEPGEDSSRGTVRWTAVLPGTVKTKGSLSAQESLGRRCSFFLRLMLWFFDYGFQVFFPSWLIKLCRLKRTPRAKADLLQLSTVSNLAL